MISMRVEQGQPVTGKLVYRAAEYAFATEPRPASCGASFTINEIELMLADEDRQRVVFVEGYCPHTGWRMSVLRPPDARPGLLGGEAGSPITAGSAIAVHPKDDRWPVLVDPATGWVRLGQGSPEQDREGVQFAPGAVAVLDGDRLRALWLHPEQLPAL
jgi:hypothetical protein